MTQTTRHLVVSAVVFSAAIFSIQGCGKTVPHAAEAKTEAPVRVLTAPVTMAPMAARLKVTGNLEGIMEATVASETQGRVLNILRSTGARVSIGTPLVQVDNELKIVAVKQAEATQMSAEAALQKSNIDLERTMQLVKDNAATKNQLELSQLQVKASQATLQSAEAAVTMAKRQLSDATVRAPISGIVSMRYINQGEMLMPGAKVVTIVDDAKMKLRMNVGEEDVTNLKVGQKVNVAVDALGKNYTGTVTAISGKADVAHSYPVEVELANPGELKSGMFARAEIQRQSPHDVPTVPTNAIVTTGSRSQVYLVNDNTVSLRAVKIGTTAGDRVEILDGLDSTDQVVTFGQNLLHDGARIAK